MTRFRADLLLFLAAIIWGSTFVVQKTGMEGLGPFGFVGVRYALSLLVVLPLVFWEQKRRKNAGITIKPRPVWVRRLLLAGVLAGFVVGVILQQIGMKYVSVTNAGFLTGLYVVMVPFVVWAIFRKRPSLIVWVASFMAIMGVWFLNGMTLDAVGIGDLLVVLCAACFAVHMVLLSILLQEVCRPFLFSALPYALCALVGLTVGVFYEGITLAALYDNAWELAYAGIVSGGIAHTLQPVAQQHSPPADAAIILSGEALFAAIAGFIFLGERLDFIGWIGCGFILAAMVLVEAGVFIVSRRQKTTLDVIGGVV